MNKLIYLGNELYVMTFANEAEAENIAELLKRQTDYFLEVTSVSPTALLFFGALDGISYLQSVTEYQFMDGCP